MKTWKLLLRQLVKTVAGLILTALAVAILVTCFGQYYAAVLTRAEIKDRYDTIALTTDAVQSLVGTEYMAYSEWLRNTVETRTDIIKTVSDTGLLSAYIPEMTPDNYTQHFQAVGNYLGEAYGAPYSCAIFVVTLDEIGTEIMEDKILGNGSDGAVFELRKSVSIRCKGTVDQVIALQEGFSRPEGYTIDLTMKAADEAAIKAMGLKTGQQYFVYGMDYYDHDWLFRRRISKNEWNFSQPYDRNKVYEDHPLGPDYEVVDISGLGIDFSYYENTVHGEKTYVHFDPAELAHVRNCALTICDFAALPDLVFKLDENHNILGFELLKDQRVLLEDENSDQLMQYGSELIDAGKFKDKYALPTMVELNGSAESFLASEQGAPWRNVMESMAINNHAFPVLAVDKLGYQAEFAREQVRLVAGRDFTQEELKTGAKVCVISESRAIANGLKIGDTLTLQTYFYDPNIWEPVNDYPATAFPDASFYSHTKGFSSKPETYTIISLYRQDHEWEGGSSYGFTPNTLFIPKNAANAKMVMAEEGVFRSIVLYNGKLEAFQRFAKDAGYEDMFVFYERGYSQISAGLNAYAEVAGKVVTVGIAAYAGILFLFLILFPGRQKQTLATMGNLGTPMKRKCRFILSSSFAIWIPGTILGAVGSMFLQNAVTAELMASIGVDIPLVFRSSVIIPAVAIAQLGVTFAAVFAYGMLLLKDQGMHRKMR